MRFSAWQNGGWRLETLPPLRPTRCPQRRHPQRQPPPPSAPPSRCRTCSTSHSPAPAHRTAAGPSAPYYTTGRSPPPTPRAPGPASRGGRSSRPGRRTCPAAPGRPPSPRRPRPGRPRRRGGAGGTPRGAGRRRRTGGWACGTPRRTGGRWWSFRRRPRRPRPETPPLETPWQRRPRRPRPTGRPRQNPGPACTHGGPPWPPSGWPWWAAASPLRPAPSRPSPGRPFSRWLSRPAPLPRINGPRGAGR
mmetsp:Transcript_57617/g.126232  ORF Transcript_57617/g.126232 Transcript_57617/m.126232 type:complete len:248 (-) Transcript_57617:351-1094(-)